jgi:hypothetical protein
VGNPDGQLGKISDFFEVIARNFDEMFKIPCKKVRKIFPRLALLYIDGPVGV